MHSIALYNFLVSQGVGFLLLRYIAASIDIHSREIAAAKSKHWYHTRGDDRKSKDNS
jgi:hypothetical protein